MPEPYKSEFMNLYSSKKANGYLFFEEKKEYINDLEFNYLICNVDMDILKCAIHIAKEKCKFTMNQNQAAIPRDKVTKLIKCAQGILAEMFVHLLLVERYDFCVIRYDLERDTFVYKNEEYDIKIILNDKSYVIESRSSNMHHKSIINFIENDVIIGPYVNSLKVNENLSDFHFRPIYMPDFIPFIYKNGKFYYNNDMVNGNIKLIITGVATKDEFLKYGYISSLGQKGTKYFVINTSKVGDIKVMDSKFNQLT